MSEEADLQSALRLIESLRSQKEALRANFDMLKAEQERVEAEKIEWKEKYLILYEDKVSLETNHEALVAEWKRQLDEKAAEFEAVRAALNNPREVEVMRIKLLEELEEPHKATVAALEAEVERYRSFAGGLRRELELTRAAGEHEANQAASRMEEIERRAEMAEEESRARMARMKSLLEASKDDGRMRAVMRENEELAARSHAYHNELEEMKTRLQSIQAEGDSALRSVERQLIEERATARTLMGEKEAALRQVSGLESQLTAALSAHDVLAASSTHAEKELLAARTSHDEMCSRFNAELASARDKAAEDKSQAERERVVLQGALDGAVARLEGVQRELANATRKLEDADRETAVKIRQATAEAGSRASAAEEALRSAESKIAVLEAEKEELLRSSTTSSGGSGARIGALESELGVMRESLVAARREATDGRLAKEELESRMEEARRDLGTEREKVKMLEAREKKLREEYESLSATTKLLEAEIERMLETMEANVASTRAENAAAENSWQTERASLRAELDRVRGDKERVQESHERLKALTKQDRTAYLAKVASLKSQVSLLSSRLGRHDSERAALKAKADEEVTKLRAELGRLNRSSGAVTSSLSAAGAGTETATASQTASLVHELDAELADLRTRMENQ